MNIPRFAGLLLAEHDYRVFGNSHHIEVLDRLLRTARALGQSHKGHSQESHDDKCKHFVHHIFFLLLINMLEAPPGIRTLKYARCSAIVVPTENQKSGQVIPSKSNEMESRSKHTKGS